MGAREEAVREEIPAKKGEKLSPEDSFKTLDPATLSLVCSVSPDSLPD